MSDLKGKAAIVTGGARGIGAAICRAFAEAGARVAIFDVADADGAALAAELPGAIALHVDVSQSGRVTEAVAEVAATFGRIDILVNNAGAVTSETTDALKIRSDQLADAEAELNVTAYMTDAEWQRELSIYLDGTFFCTRAALREMLPRKSGAIVNVSSIHGIAGGTGLPHYSAAKAGVLGFTRAVAKEVAPMGVRVNAITPGYIDTETLQTHMPQSLQQATAAQTPMRRLGRPEEIAAAVRFLCADEASFITGQTLSPDGGWLTI